MPRILTATSAAAMAAVALATRAPVAMNRISAPVAKATVASSVLPATTAARGLPLMPTVGRGATGLAPALGATPAIRAPLVGMRIPGIAVLEAIRRM